MSTPILKTLICDDSMLVRKKLRELLETLGCEVLEAKNGVEAVALAGEAGAPLLVFMDIIMPELDGLEALKQIKTANPEIKVVMLSSAGTSAKLLEAVKAGADDFIQKPYTREQVIKAIEKIN